MTFTERIQAAVDVLKHNIDVTQRDHAYLAPELLPPGYTAALTMTQAQLDILQLGYSGAFDKDQGCQDSSLDDAHTFYKILELADAIVSLQTVLNEVNRA